MTALVFVDLETTGLNPRKDYIWEFAAIRREADGTETVYHRYVQHPADSALGLPESFRADHDRRYDASVAIPASVLVGVVLGLTADKPRLVGAAPWFDAGFLAQYLSDQGLKPSWSHRLVDVETLAAGKLGRLVNGLADAAEAFGIENPAAHTAMADAETAKQIYDSVMGTAD
jgi:DNA polymerase III epsilon subunit-like protein